MKRPWVRIPLKNLLKKKKNYDCNYVGLIFNYIVLPQFTSSLFYVTNQDYNFSDHSLFSHNLFDWLSTVILAEGHINPLNPTIHKQILQTDVHTFPLRRRSENLIKDQSVLLDHLINSHNRFSWLCIDIIRRKLMLVTRNRGHLDKADQSDCRKITIHSKKVGRGPISSSEKTISYSKQKIQVLIANVS